MLAHQVAGDDTAPLLFLTHGVTDSAASLINAVNRFSPDWHVIAIDSLGHGQSPRFTDDGLGRPMAAALEALRTTVKHYVSQYGPGFGFGHSMGGALLSRLAYESPDLLRGIVLEDPAWLTEKQAARYHLHAQHGGARWDESDQDSERIPADIQREYPNWPTEELVPWLKAKSEVDRQFLHLGTVGYIDPWDDWLAGLTVPTAVLTSDQPDCVIGTVGIDRIETVANPVIETILLPGLRHVMRRDDPQLLFDTARSFLTRWRDAS